MTNRENEIVEKTVGILKNILDPEKIFLFGSRAKEDGSKQADFDFAVEAEKPSIDIQRKINDEIEKISGLYKVDIVYISSVDNDFKKIIIKTGKVVHERRA